MHALYMVIVVFSIWTAVVFIRLCAMKLPSIDQAVIWEPTIASDVQYVEIAITPVNLLYVVYTIVHCNYTWKKPSPFDLLCRINDIMIFYLWLWCAFNTSCAGVTLYWSYVILNVLHLMSSPRNESLYHRWERVDNGTISKVGCKSKYYCCCEGLWVESNCPGINCFCLDMISLFCGL